MAAVTDLVEGTLLAMHSPRAVGEVFNIGNESEEVTILDLAKRVKERSRSRSEIITIPYEKAYEEGFEDMPRRVPDLGKVRGLIGYEPIVHLDEILDRVAAYFTSDKGRT
jgi:UDP-glucose 4-epimerase